MSSGRHTSHVNNTANVGRNIGCQECHSATTTTGTTIATPANHVDKNVNVKFDNSINKDTDLPSYNGAATTAANGSVKVAGSVVVMGGEIRARRGAEALANHDNRAKLSEIKGRVNTLMKHFPLYAARLK